MRARFGRRLKGHPSGPALPVSAGPRAQLETDIGTPDDDLVGLAPECDS